LVDVVDLDGALLLAADTASGVAVDRGIVRLSDEPGLGIRVDFTASTAPAPQR
jgi:L-alanine-DL-glutamate epimerase-like enolase superfamily enzyme